MKKIIISFEDKKVYIVVDNDVIDYVDIEDFNNDEIVQVINDILNN